jgi:ribosome biogenesis protein Tsr3
MLPILLYFALGAEPDKPVDCARIPVSDDRVACRWNEFAQSSRAWQRQFTRLRPALTVAANPAQAELELAAAREAMRAAFAVAVAEDEAWARKRAAKR